MQRGTCVFCGSTTNKMSAEHVWPEWFGKLMAQQGHRDFVFRGLGADRPTTSVAALKVRRVCETCNNGWMNKIEQRAKSIAAPLIVSMGGQYGLSPDAQRTLATWATLKCMVLTLTRPGGTTIPAHEFARFAEQKRPSGGSTIAWAGAYKGTRLAAWGQIGVNPSVPGPDGFVVNGYTATLILFRLIVQVVDIFSPGTYEFPAVRHGLHRIWPPQPTTLSWPDGGAAFNDHEIDMLVAPPISIVESDPA